MAVCCSRNTCKRHLLSTCGCCCTGRPEDSGISLQAVRELGKEFPLFGVCMGHQCIGQAFGGRVVRAPCGAMHGKTSLVHHTGKGVLQVRRVVYTVPSGLGGCLAAWLGQTALLTCCSLRPAAGVAASLARPGDGVGHLPQTLNLHSKLVCLLQGLESPFQAARYHSLVIADDSVPSDLEVTAWTDDGTIMAVMHRQHPHIQVRRPRLPVPASLRCVPKQHLAVQRWCSSLSPTVADETCINVHDMQAPGSQSLHRLPQNPLCLAGSAVSSRVHHYQQWPQDCGKLHPGHASGHQLSAYHCVKSK